MVSPAPLTDSSVGPDAATFSQRRLVDRLRAGEDEAFETLVQELWTPAVRFVLRITRDLDTAEDIVQDAFVLLYEHREDLDPTRSVRAYLYQTIRNRLIDQLRRAAVRQHVSLLDLPMPSPATPLRGLEGREVRESVERAVENLPDRAREAFSLAYLQDLAYREVAEVMGISPKTVGHHISAALAELRRVLAPLLPESRESRRIVQGSTHESIGRERG